MLAELGLIVKGTQMTRTCTDLGVCQNRCDSPEACDWHYIHAPVRGPSHAPQYPFAPSELDGPHYKQRNRKHLVRWLLICVGAFLCMCFISGLVDGFATYTKAMQTKARVTT